jgi:hypothetical protein
MFVARRDFSRDANSVDARNAEPRVRVPDIGNSGVLQVLARGASRERVARVTSTGHLSFADWIASKF